MTKEQYDKATEINKEIQKYGDLIAKIKQGLSTKKVGDSKRRSGAASKLCKFLACGTVGRYQAKDQQRAGFR